MFKTKQTTNLLALLLGAASLFAQQHDSLLVLPEVLAEKDIYEPLSNGNGQVKIISGSRFPVAMADLPFSAYVITKEEIRNNGYETLVDALKMVPGIRVSQPGTATDGETFLMRGLLGNTYAKILLNDVPIRPTVLASLPIGAQLPVKEAERIEIIYGAGAALYGADAGAGVINIITRESNKPVFMQADLSVGNGVYSSVNVMFGGRLGRDKKVLRYFAYGSNVLLERRKIFYDKGYNYLPSTYSTDSLYLDLPNFGGQANDPILTSTPHLSRKFGFSLKYKGLTLSGESMYRRDHSSLGLNPVAYSYRNPLTFIGETMVRLNLNIYKERKKHNRKTDISFYRYQTDERSSVLPVNNRLSQMLRLAAEARAKAAGNDSSSQYYKAYYNDFLDGLRYLYAASNEFRVEHVRNYQLFKKTTLTLGGNLKIAQVEPLAGYFSRPLDEEDYWTPDGEGTVFNDRLYSTIYNASGGLNEANAFSQLFYNGNSLKLTAGMNYTLFGSDLTEHFYGKYRLFSPRLSALWEFAENINIRSAWGHSYRPTNPFYEANSYAVVSDSRRTLYRPNDLAIRPEKTTSWESGFRLKTSDGQIGTEALWFLNSTNDLIRYQASDQYLDADSTQYFGVSGFANTNQSTVRYTGYQVLLYLSFTINNFVIKSQISASTLRLRTKGPTEIAGLPRGTIAQFRNSFSPTKKSFVTLDLLQHRNLAITGGPNPKKVVWTCDLLFRYAFTDRFDGYLKATNLFNKQYSGILPDTDPNDLLRYNPQSGIFLRLGMNYHIE